MSKTYYGIVSKDGQPENPGSANWSAEKRNTGKYKVTLSGASASPVPVACVASNDLDSHHSGAKSFVNITDIGQENGRWYFGVAIDDQDGSLRDMAFSFTAEAS